MHSLRGFILVWIFFTVFILVYGYQMLCIWNDEFVYGDASYNESSTPHKIIKYHERLAAI